MTDDVEQEDRGTPCLIYANRHGRYAFNWFPDSKSFLISVPVGWSMFAHPHVGAVLRDVFGRIATPDLAASFAREGYRGFRLRKESP